MKHVVKKIGIEKASIKEACLFTRAKVGPHLGLVLDSGKANSILIGITHADALNKEINTIDCEFSSLINKPEVFNNIMLKKVKESRAVLTIVNNETLNYKNPKLLEKLKYSTGLSHYPEQNYLKSKILFRNKIQYLSDEYNSKDPCILYQTKNKTEIVSIKNEERLIELVGINSYNNYFKPILDLSLILTEKKLPLADILIDKMNSDGIEGLMKILNKLSSS